MDIDFSKAQTGSQWMTRDGSIATFVTYIPNENPDSRARLHIKGRGEFCYFQNGKFLRTCESGNDIISRAKYN